MKHYRIKVRHSFRFNGTAVKMATCGWWEGYAIASMAGDVWSSPNINEAYRLMNTLKEIFPGMCVEEYDV